MKIVRLKSVESTNDAAWKEAVAGAPDGTVVVAEEQSGGRGRFGRTWDSPRGGLYLSWIHRRPVEHIALVTAVGALALIDAIGDGKIRFPNDVLLRGKKVAGILVESRFVGSKPDMFVIGIGVNVNRKKFPDGVVATSVTIPLPDLERGLLDSMGEWLDRLEGPVDPFRERWKRDSAILGTRVKVRERGQEFVGVVEETDPIDGLVLRLENGHVCGIRPELVEHLEMLAP